MGLVGVDVVIALTVGRGGKFVENGGGLRYRPERPRAAASDVLAERSTVHREVGDGNRPHRCLRADDLHRPTRSTRSAAASTAAGDWSTCGSELLPLLFAEMSARYYAQVAFQDSGSAPPARRCASARQRPGSSDRFDRRAGASRRARSAASTPRSCSSAINRSTTRATTTSRSSTRRFADDLREAEVPGRRQPREVRRRGVSDLPRPDALGRGAGGTLARLLSGLQR